MTSMLEDYAAVAGVDVVQHLQQLAKPLQGMKVVHVNSTRVGGGVAEILDKLVPLSRDLGIDAHWEVISGNAEFYNCTKTMHNALQGSRTDLSEDMIRAYQETNAQNAEQLCNVLQDADFVIIHDPQPAALLQHCPQRKGKWIWRCHIDASHPYRSVWRFLKNYVRDYDASIFSLAQFAQALPHPEYIIPPSIDPLSEKNIELPESEINDVYNRFDIDPGKPLIVQVSRFDRFKDPVGVIHAYRLAKKFVPHLQLVLAGGGATDDPEGDVVLQEVHNATQGDPELKVLVLPPDAHRTINALQRAADIVLQKSTKEGFGLTVTEAMWKGKPVIGGDTGGIRLQVVNFHTGFLVNTPEGAALRIRYLLHQREKIQDIGEKARQFVKENFLLTRQLRENLTLMVGMFYGAGERIELK
jgi:trehalose synthase